MIDKRGSLSLALQLEESHPTVSAMAPLVCFVTAFTLLILLRFVIFFGAVTAGCVDTAQFWYSSTGGNWPLVGSFFLAASLLFVWNIFIAIDDWKRSRGTRVMIVVNTIGIAALLCTFGWLHEAATVAYDVRAGLYDNLEYRGRFLFSRSTESECATTRRFVGRWRVVERKIGAYGFDIPAQWVELEPWGYLYAQNASWSRIYSDWWRPPFKAGSSDAPRWFAGDLFNAPWDFDLRGDTLILTSPEEWYEFEWQRSRVTLRREPIPELPVYPNPFAAVP
ncbi:MAG: hypothetical protein WB812_17440 [Woeseiaceae bacterium]